MASIYETSADIIGFRGLNQAGDGYNLSMQYARELKNVNITGGRFAPMREGKMIAQTLPAPIGTLACLSRRYGVAEDERNVLVAVAGGHIYTKLLDHDDEWIARSVTAEGGGALPVQSDYFDYVTYEVNEEGSDPIDVLIMSNAVDGMLVLYGNDLHIVQVGTPYKFGTIARHNERIWGSGIIGMPDSLVYSAPYDPFNWEPNEEIPEDGGGEIMSPSWDGDAFIALKPYGSQLLAFKKNAIWRVLGTDPGEFIVREQCGHGAMHENPICRYNDVVYMLGFGGLMRYDGALVLPFKPEEASGVLRNRMNWDAVDQTCAVIRDRTYCLAIPLDGSTVNNAVLEYNCGEGTFTLRENTSVKAFLKEDDRIFYTSATTPGCVFEMADEGLALPVHWESGFQDLGAKSAVKSTFVVYFIADAPTPFDLTIGIRTEKKLKNKRIHVKPGKPYRTQLNVQGRFFRLELDSSTIVPYSIDGGIRLTMELDPD